MVAGVNVAMVERLLQSDEPSVQLSVRLDVLDEDPGSPSIAELREEVRPSPRARTLIEAVGKHPYAKWRGAHWVLVDLAELGYPAGDSALEPLVERELAWLLDPRRQALVKHGRPRQHASLEGNAIFALASLELVEPDDPRLRELVERLLAWQWPDGGWNCDPQPRADTSSFFETITPMRGLARYARLSGDDRAGQAVARAAEVFLTRRLFRRRSDGSVMHPHFVRLHFPCYWHYDILFGLQVMKEAGFIHDPRCDDGLELLQSKQLLGGGWAAEGAYWRFTTGQVSGRSSVRWGPVGKSQPNEFVTARGLGVLHAAGRLDSVPALSLANR
jgi:hypothetical protein